jgi:chaperonin GroES
VEEIAMAKKKAPKVKPIGDRLLVKRIEAEETTAGGIVIPDSAKEKPKEGEVISLGEGRLLDSGDRVPFQVNTGDRVLFTSYAGNEVKIGGEEYLIMSEDDILAVLEK